MQILGYYGFLIIRGCITIKVLDSTIDFTREKLKGPFGFKGRYVDELWNVRVTLKGEKSFGKGMSVQSILWSDSSVFAANSPAGGNALMFSLTCRALALVQGESFKDPCEMIRYLIPEIMMYGKLITGNPKLRTTFVLNALVAVDYAAWQLYAREYNIKDFDGLIPNFANKALSNHNTVLSRIPLISYSLDEEEITGLIKDGHSMLKIKIGSDPDGDDDQKKMLEWDKQRLSQIHNISKNFRSSYTESGYIQYYLDANGRYQTKELLMEFLMYADEIDALDRVILLEEPFDEDSEINVGDLPVRIAADESAHTVDDALKRIKQGYGAIALKPIAKTQSVSFEIAGAAHELGIPCFCADLTVNPILLEWNKCFAARLNNLPEMNTGVIETNGEQNYMQWSRMEKEHPRYGAAFTKIKNGVYELDYEFYACSGGVLDKM